MADWQAGDPYYISANIWEEHPQNSLGKQFICLWRISFSNNGKVNLECWAFVVVVAFNKAIEVRYSLREELVSLQTEIKGILLS